MRAILKHKESVAKHPSIKKNGHIVPVSSPSNNEDILPKYIEKYMFEGKEYNLIYKDVDPMRDNETITVEPKIAHQRIKEYIENEFGRYIDGEFMGLNESIKNKMEKLKNELASHIESKIDVIVEGIVTELVSSHFKDTVKRKVDEKLKRLGELLDKDDE